MLGQVLHSDFIGGCDLTQLHSHERHATAEVQ